MTGAGLPAFDGGGLAWNLLGSAAAALAVLLAAFAVGAARGVHRVVDVAWGAAFAAVAAVTFVLSSGVLSPGHGDAGRRLLATVLTAAWGLRLAVHIARRGRGKGEDPRYARMLARAPGSPALYALRTVYLAQAALVWLVSLPVQAAQYVRQPPGPLAWAAVAVWLAGMLFEAVGDAQLARFRADPAHRGRIMDRGLWSWTRHPNYFGDFLVWWGLYLLAAPAPPAVAVPLLVSPVLMSLLLTVGSGKRLLERHMADRPGYAEYASRTSGFFPLPPGRGVSGKRGR